MKVDKRIQRTKTLIKSSFLKLLNDYPLEKITISEITDNAMCNRNTFYLHYNDKYDLMETLCDEATSVLKQELSIAMKKYNNSEEFYKIIPKICMDVMQSNLPFYTAVLGKNRYPLFIEKYKEVLFDFSLSILPYDLRKKKEKIIELEYATNGVIGVHRFYLLHLDEYDGTEILKLSNNLSITMGKLINGEFA